MAGQLTDNSYGKSRVRMMKVVRTAASHGTERHDLVDLTVDILLQGDFETVFTLGDNSKILPTDTMKNTVYALGKDHPLETIESFAHHLGGHFLADNPQVAQAQVNISENIWERVEVAGQPHRHTFIKPGGEQRTCTVITSRDRTTFQSGIANLLILKTTGSAFTGFVQDQFTTLQETEDRILATNLSCRWIYNDGKADFASCRKAIRQALIETFAEQHSLSVQHTLHAMGQRAFEVCPAVTKIGLSMPNKHCLLVDLSSFGLENKNEIFVPIDEPHGIIEATLERR